MSKDLLGDRMKEQYENRTRIYLPRRTYTLIRLDGNAFHTYTKGLKRPFDKALSDAMDQTTIYLCENIQGCKLGYVQSDEITLLLTDFDDIVTNAWFDNELRKICSLSAAKATAKFNHVRTIQKIMEIGIQFDEKIENQIVDDEDYDEDYDEDFSNINVKFSMKDCDEYIFNMKLGVFDSRVWTISDREEVINTFIWRQQDCTRNSISMVAQSLYSHKELMNKNSSELQEMIFQKGINWDTYPIRNKRGGLIKKVSFEHESGTTRTKWIVDEPPIFTQDRNYLNDLIPKLN